MTGIGPRLREERSRLKMSQTALGAKGGVETNAQGNYENGIRSPKADYLLRIAAVGVDINYVLSGKRQLNSSILIDEALSQPAINLHLSRVTHQLHRNLYGLIDALYQMTQLVEARASDVLDDRIKHELDTVRTEAQALAQASVRLIFVTSKFG